MWKHMHECPRCGNHYMEAADETETCEASYTKTCPKCYKEMSLGELLNAAKKMKGD